MIKQLPAKEFLLQFDPFIYDSLKNCINKTQASAVVCFENVNFDSSQFGARTGVAIGPGCTFETVEDCDGHWLYDLPSQRQYPQNYADAKELLGCLEVKSV